MQFRLKPVAAALMFAVMGGISISVQAVEVAAGELDAALSGLAKETGIQILFDANVLKGAKTAGVHNAATPEEALKQVLQGSGYTFKPTGNNSFVVQRQHVAKMGEPDRLEELYPITVTATRAERNVDEVPASVSVLTAKKLKTKNRQNMYEALRDDQGLDFTSGQPNVAHQLFPVIRGVGTSSTGMMTTQLLVDGLPADSVVSSVLGHGGLNFTAPQDVAQVEVVRGPVSSLYGPGAVGGVINVIPKRWKGEEGAEVNASYGSHNTQTVGAAVGTAKENFDVRLSVYDAKSDGYISVPDPNIPLFFVKGGNDLSGKDWKDSKVGLTTSFRPADRHEITFDLTQFGTKSAYNYGGRPNDRHNLDGQSVTLGYRFDQSEDTSIKANFRATNLKQNWLVDKGDRNGLAVPGIVTAADLVLASRSERVSDSTFFHIQMDTHPIAGNQLTAGYSHETGKYQASSTTVGAATNTTVSEDKVDAFFIQDEHKAGAFMFTLGGRYDRIDLSPDTLNGTPRNGNGSVANVFNPRVGVRFHFNEVTSFFAAAGTAYVPVPNTLKFVQPSTVAVDNSNLVPETSTTYEVGMNNTLRIGKLSTSVYRTDYKDKLIYGTDLASGKRQWQNTAVTKVAGVEIAYQGDLGNGWLPYANFAYTKAQDQLVAGGAFRQSTRITPRKLNMGFTYEPNSSWSATLNGRAVSDMYFNNLTAAQHQGGYFQADAKLNFRLPVQGDKWEAFVACNNITDKKYQPRMISEWWDGRTFTVGVNGKL